MTRVLLFVLLMVGLATPAVAQCFSQREVEAERGLRIHTELMQIGLNCMAILQKPQLYADYRAFTARNEDLIGGWEDILIAYFDRNGGNGERQFHNYRTRMANQISSSAARMRPDVFCHNYVGRLNRAMGMSRGDLTQWASIGGGELPSKPLCASAR